MRSARNSPISSCRCASPRVDGRSISTVSRSPGPRRGPRPGRARRTGGSWRGYPGSRSRARQPRDPSQRRCQGRWQRAANGCADDQPLAGDRSCGGHADIEGARSRPARVRRASARHRMADRPAALANDGGRLDAERRVAVGGPGAADEARRRARREGRRRASSRATAIPTRCRARRPRSTASSSGPARRTDFDFPTLAGAFRIDVGRGRFTKIEPGSASCSACCRCSRCRGASRSISPTSSARASRSTRSPATYGSPAAS